MNDIKKRKQKVVDDAIKSLREHTKEKERIRKEEEMLRRKREGIYAACRMRWRDHDNKGQVPHIFILASTGQSMVGMCPRYLKGEDTKVSLFSPAVFNHQEEDLQAMFQSLDLSSQYKLHLDHCLLYGEAKEEMKELYKEWWIEKEFEKELKEYEENHP